MKLCSKCGELKIHEDFYSREGKNKFYYSSYCKACAKKKQKLYRLKNINDIKRKEKTRRNKTYKERSTYQKNYRKLHKAKNAEYQKLYRKTESFKRSIGKRKNWIKSYMQKYFQERKQSDPLFKLSINLRKRLNMAVRKNSKRGSAVKDLGCTIEELKIYLESKFQQGMTWENYGRSGWHIDHIIPLSSYDLSSREQLLKACHYTNLQPLWAKDNLTKSNKLES